ncbi:MAG TPA: hypothetical protein PLX03_03850 [Candidatus Hydrogenedentes bacterium]|nr:hypothetical protein [Candidatus Hydrogenedentota bacterium]
MSSTVVATPVSVITPQALMAVGGGLAATGLAAFLAVSVSKALEECARAAKAEAEKRKRDVEAWNRLREKVMASRTDEANAEAMVVSMERQLVAVTLGSASAVLDFRDTEKSRGDRPAWLDLSVNGPPPGWGAKEALAEIMSFLNHLKTETSSVPEAVVQTLLDQAETMKKRAEQQVPPDYDEIRSFSLAVDESIREARKETTRRREAFEIFAANVEQVLDELLYLEALAEQLSALEDRHRTEIRSLKTSLTTLLEAGEAKPGSLELVQERIKALRLAVETATVMEHQYAGLAESMQRNLREMGYACETPLPHLPSAGATQHVAVFSIPGGEQLRVGIDRHLRLNFEVEHVRGPRESPDTPLSASEQALFMRQETRWCADVHELLRRMAAEGFPFEISLEKNAVVDRIRVAVVETAQELLDANEEVKDKTETHRHLRMNTDRE